MWQLNDLKYFFSRQRFGWVHADTELRPSAIEGAGRFARSHISKSTVVAVCAGYALDLRQEPNRTGIQVSDHFVLQGSLSHGANGGINHSCSPNCRIDGQVLVRTIVDIAPGQELCLDYGSFLFTSIPKIFISECSCLTRDCRGVITGDDWRKLPTELLSLFLKEKRECELNP